MIGKKNIYVYIADNCPVGTAIHSYISALKAAESPSTDDLHTTCLALLDTLYCEQGLQVFLVDASGQIREIHELCRDQIDIGKNLDLLQAFIAKDIISEDGFFIQERNILGKESSEPLFNFDWRDLHDTECANDVIRHWLKENGYEWRYNQHGRLEALIRGKWVNFQYKNKGSNIGAIYLVTKEN